MQSQDVVPIDDPDYIKGLLVSMGVTEFDEEVVRALQDLAAEEFANLARTAGRIHALAGMNAVAPNAIDFQSARLACRLADEYGASGRGLQEQLAPVTNARPLAWSLGATVRVPAAEYASFAHIHEADVAVGCGGMGVDASRLSGVGHKTAQAGMHSSSRSSSSSGVVAQAGGGMEVDASAPRSTTYIALPQHHTSALKLNPRRLETGVRAGWEDE